MAISLPVSGQTRENNDTRKMTAEVLRSCHIEGGWVKVVLGANGELRAERSPSLTSDQHDCVSSYIGQPRTLRIDDDAERRRLLQDQQ